MQWVKFKHHLLHEFSNFSPSDVYFLKLLSACICYSTSNVSAIYIYKYYMYNEHTMRQKYKYTPNQLNQTTPFIPSLSHPLPFLRNKEILKSFIVHDLLQQKECIYNTDKNPSWFPRWFIAHIRSGTDLIMRLVFLLLPTLFSHSVTTGRKCSETRWECCFRFVRNSNALGSKFVGT